MGARVRSCLLIQRTRKYFWLNFPTQLFIHLSGMVVMVLVMVEVMVEVIMVITMIAVVVMVVVVVIV